MLIPKPLQKGDKVAIVATAKRLESSYQEGVDLLKTWGFETIVYDSINATSGYFAGDDELRINDLQHALNDERIRAILFLRGGYGTTRVIDHIDFSAFKNTPKWLIGFSDITSILLHAVSLHIPAIHGQVAITLGRDNQADDSLKRILKGEERFEFPLNTSPSTKIGHVAAPIVGGNLCMICDSLGTPSEIETEGCILFLEEIGEEFYAVDRMMNQLKRAGKFSEIRGLILGDFSAITDRQSYFESSIEELIVSYFSDLKIPMACGLHAGHEKINYPLIFGCKTEMEVQPNSIQLRYHLK